MTDVAGAAARVGIVVVSLALWHWTQRLIAARAMHGDGVGDRVHEWTAGAHAWLAAHPRATDRMLIASSLVVDALGLGLIGLAVAGPTFRPFVGVLLLFVLRQVCQAACAMPIPRGMIWRDPGFPSLLVTYGTGNDLFFSGHTALCVLGTMEIARIAPPAAAVACAVVAVLQVVFVLLLRAHWTADVIAAVFAALCCGEIAARVAPAVDGWIASIG